MIFTAASHPAKCGGGVKYDHHTISFLLKPGFIYLIAHNNGAHHLPNIVSTEEKVSFAITAFTTMGHILRHCDMVHYPSAQASKKLIMKVNHLNTMYRRGS
jgi:hypothetical protein